MVIRHMESQRNGHICPLTGLQNRRPFFKGGAAPGPTGGLEHRPTGPEVEEVGGSLRSASPTIGQVLAPVDAVGFQRGSLLLWEPDQIAPVAHSPAQVVRGGLHGQDPELLIQSEPDFFALVQPPQAP